MYILRWLGWHQKQVCNWELGGSNHLMLPQQPLVNHTQLYRTRASSNPLTQLRSLQQDQFINMTYDSILKLRFISQNLSNFVCVEAVSTVRMPISILLPFATFYPCKTSLLVLHLRPNTGQSLKLSRSWEYCAILCFRSQFEKQTSFIVANNSDILIS